MFRAPIMRARRCSNFPCTDETWIAGRFSAEAAAKASSSAESCGINISSKYLSTASQTSFVIVPLTLNCRCRSESPAVPDNELNGVLQFSPTHRKRSPAEIDVAGVAIYVRVAGFQPQCAPFAGVEFHDASQIEHKICGAVKAFLSGL